MFEKYDIYLIKQISNKKKRHSNVHNIAFFWFIAQAGKG